METEILTGGDKASKVKEAMGAGNPHKANVGLMCLVGRGMLFEAEDAAKEMGRELTLKELLSIAEVCMEKKDEEVAGIAFSRAEDIATTSDELLMVASAYSRVDMKKECDEFLVKAVNALS